MTSFFVDIWADLREKRLWPAAVALIAAIVAVPVVLFKPASDAAPPTTGAPHGSKVPTLPVVHVDGGPLLGSHLEAFSASEKNPFKPMKDLAKADSGSTGAASSSGGASAGAAGGAGAGASGGSGAAGSGGSTGSTGGGTPSSGGGTTTKTTHWFHYVADFNFGQSGEKPTNFKGKASYTILPDEKTPVVVFLGLGADHKSALFFVSDPAFDAQGEGSCIGTGTCQFVTLSLDDTGDEETFSSADGSVSYDLQLLKIRQESLGTGSQPNTPSTPSTPSSPKGKAASAAGAGVAAAANSASEAALPAVFVDGPGVAVQQPK